MPAVLGMFRAAVKPFRRMHSSKGSSGYNHSKSNDNTDPQNSYRMRARSGQDRDDDSLEAHIITKATDFSVVYTERY